MSEIFWKRLSYVVGLLAIGTVFGLAGFLSQIEIKDLDLWLHMGMGRFILQNGYIPVVDVLSCSISGHPWINHEWLFQIIVYLIHSQWGIDGLVMMQSVIVIITLFILLLIGYQKEKQLGAIFILLVTLMIYYSRFTYRPDLFSLLFFALYFFILSMHINKKWSTWVLFVIQALWSNLHGFFFFGPLIVLIALVSEWAKRHVPLPYEWNETGRLTDEEYARLKKILIFVLLGCLVNPLGWQGAWYPIQVLFSISGDTRIFFDYIIELKRPLTWKTFFSFDGNIFYKGLIVLSFTTFVFNRRNIDIGILFIWVFFLCFSLIAMRNMPYFAFAGYFVFIINTFNLSLSDIAPFEVADKKFTYITSVVFKLVLILWILQFGSDASVRGYFDFDKYERKSEYGGLALRSYPIKAVDFLVENKIRGNFFNDFNVGAYLVGRCHPDIKVFIDGRTEVYGGAFFKRYQEIVRFGKVKIFDDLVNQLNITGVILGSVHHAIPEELLRHLYKSQDWHLVYMDYDAVIFLKNTPENKTVIEKNRIDLSLWEPQKLDLLRLGAKNVTPYPFINRAFTLEALDFNEAAEKEAQAALEIDPNYAAAYKIIGKIAGKNKLYQKAFENFRKAALFSPQDKEIRYNLALAYTDLEEYEYAIREYQRLVELDPENAKPYFILSQTYIKDKQYDKARVTIQTAYQLDRNAFKDFLKIGDLFYEEKQYLFAKEVYQWALNSKKNLGEAYYKLGLSSKSLGENIKAKEYLNKGLKIDPNNGNIIEALEEFNVVVPVEN